MSKTTSQEALEKMLRMALLRIFLNDLIMFILRMYIKTAFPAARTFLIYLSIALICV